MIRHLQRDYFDCVYADTSDGSGFSSCNFSDVAQAYKIPAKRIQGKNVEKYAGKFLEQGGTGASGDHAGAWNLRIPEDLSGRADP